MQVSRNQSLDVLRGAAVLMVIGHHYGYYGFWARHGGMGVDLFFVLSGYLISGLLFSEYKRTGEINLWRFLIRRGFKIYPAYYFLVLLLLPFTFRSVTLADFTFMGAYFPVLWGHAWSLSVEEHFYLVLPVALILSLRVFRSQKFEWIPWTAPFLCAACLMLRYRYALHHSVFYGISQTHMRIDTLFAGVTLAWFKHFHSQELRVRRAELYGIAGMIALFRSVGLDPTIGASVGNFLLLVSFSLLLVWAVNCAWLGKLKPLSKVGFYSYSIYLWHWPIARMFEGTLSMSFVSFWLYVTICICVGILMAKLIETPFLRLRDRLFPSVNIRADLFSQVDLQQVLRTRAGAADCRAVVDRSVVFGG